ncbi:hypothetical protein M408DRAFT_236030 [Serendipita vermifera MAFF 305830]|uniref:Uncharacterized protein n=1 Tax=Serendipita vermifera MAFF 305830 TaxID=933852 RepID=A0A0C3B4A1_SERVB|nr:hypothetical protein M408DRAFT_236030 [Serendipita vermifera MAFF 305830]
MFKETESNPRPHLARGPYSVTRKRKEIKRETGNFLEDRSISQSPRASIDQEFNWRRTSLIVEHEAVSLHMHQQLSICVII